MSKRTRPDWIKHAIESAGNIGVALLCLGIAAMLLGLWMGYGKLRGFY